MILVWSFGSVFAAEPAPTVQVCHWETSWSACKANNVGRLCQPGKAAGDAPTEVEARHACYEARASPVGSGVTHEAFTDCTIQCAAGAPLVLPSIVLQEGAAPELRAALFRARPALAKCVAGVSAPSQVDVSASVVNGTLRVTRLTGAPTAGDCLTRALQEIVQAGPNGGTTITLKWAAREG